MTNRIRHFLFFSFIVLFFVLSGLILPYAFGYKLSWSGLIWQRTGIFDIKTTPSGAAIFLNDKQQINWLGRLSGQPDAARTPVKLKNIIPGTYQVRLELDGYWSWSKPLVIRPGATTYLEDVYLFKKNQPVALTTPGGQILAVAASPDRNYAAVVTTERVLIFNLKKGRLLTDLAAARHQSAAVSWSDDGNWLLTGQLAINWRDRQIDDLSAWGLTVINHAAWADNDSLYLTADQKLHKLNLKNQQLVMIDLSEKILDFTMKNGYCYYFGADDPEILKVVKPNDNGQAEKIMAIKLKSPGDYHFLDLGNDTVNAQDGASRRVFSISTKLPWLKDYAVKDLGVVGVGRWVNGDRLVNGNGFELGLSANGENKLLTRVSHAILALSWHQSNNYVVFATTNDINVLELDNRDTYNITALWQADSITHPVFNRDGNGVLFLSNDNGQPVVYWLGI